MKFGAVTEVSTFLVITQVSSGYITLCRKDSLCVLACRFCVRRKGGTGGVGTTPHPDCIDMLRKHHSHRAEAGFWQERLLGL